MSTIISIGSGVTEVTTAYALACRGYSVTIFDRQRYPAMDTSFANGGQLSASNAEVWNSLATIVKGVKWMLRKNAPLLLNPKPQFSQVFLARRVRRSDPSLPPQYDRDDEARDRRAAIFV
ncbi:FAD-dependent oxidoreductase [Bradyrhizobium sp. LM2.9]